MASTHARLTLALVLSILAGGCSLALDLDPPDPQLLDASRSDLGDADLGVTDLGRADLGDARIELDAGPRCATNSECSDGDPCNGEERCTARGCQRARVLDCNDDLDCTRDSCVPFIGCENVADDSLCDVIPGGSCDVASRSCQYPTCDSATCIAPPCGTATCAGATCVVASRCTAMEECCGDRCVPLFCDDGKHCTDDMCDMSTSRCVNVPNENTCDDGDVCTLDDVCASGFCVASTTITCRGSADPCQLDICDRVLGCMTVDAPVGTSCDDDLNACTAAICRASACMRSAMLCSDDGNPCTADACDPSTGACTAPPVRAGTPCMLSSGTASTCDGSGTCGGSTFCIDTRQDCDRDGFCECLLSAGGGCLDAMCVTGAGCPVRCAADELCCPSTATCVSRSCTGAGCCPSGI